MVEALIHFVKQGKVLTAADGYKDSVEEQLMKGLLDNIKKKSLTTQKPAINKQWNTQSLFNRSAFFVEERVEQQPEAVTIKQLYAREEAKLDHHEKYGYSKLTRKPLPEEYYKRYESEAKLNEEKQADYKLKKH